MLDDAAIAAAATLLWRTWNDGAVIEALPPAMRPATRADGYRIQAAIEVRSTRSLYGWKIAATSKVGQAHIAVDGPLAGRLLAERAFSSGARLKFGANRMRVAEPEFAFRFGRSLLPRPATYVVDDVLAATAWGEPVDVGRHRPAAEVKGATYTELRVAERSPGEWIAQCVVDV